MAEAAREVTGYVVSREPGTEETGFVVVLIADEKSAVELVGR